jgi:leader peptidase (prepilin peptidase)/N-methyltransferase
MTLPHTFYILFFFALGACIGSFLNVVVWRLPQVTLPPDAGPLQDFLASFKALSDPPSHCPSCNNLLKWYDNIPILGWIQLRGKCRFCKQPISLRYPIVELVTALLFAGYYVAFYMLQVRTCCPAPRVLAVHYDVLGFAHEITHPQWIISESWPIFLLYLALIAGLLAASLIDAELFIIPVQIPWVLALLGFAVHALADQPAIPGSLNLVGSNGPAEAALAAGGMLGLVCSVLLWMRGIIPTSFAQGEPLLEVDRKQIQQEMDRAKKSGETWEQGPLPPDYTPMQIRLEIGKEMLFLLPPMIGGGAFAALTAWSPALHGPWQQLILDHTWLSGMLGSFLGAMIGGFVVWITRILATLAMRRVAMGLGDVHLMFGVGAIIGAGGATIAFFVAPFFGILTALYMLITRRGREIPLGPYLSLATAVVLLCYCPMWAHLQPGLEGLLIVAHQLLQTGKLS